MVSLRSAFEFQIEVELGLASNFTTFQILQNGTTAYFTFEA
jgi:hypothetical protein